MNQIVNTVIQYISSFINNQLEPRDVQVIAFKKMKTKFRFHLKNVATTVAKRVAITAIALGIALSASAQQGEKAVGGYLTLGTGDEYTNIGIGAKFQYNVTDPLRLEGSFTYFPKIDDISMWDLSANIHCLIPVADQIALYPLGGLSIMNAKYQDGKYSDSENAIGVNIGGGIDIKLIDQIVLNFELKYRIGLGELDFNRFCVSAGVVFKF